jgi:hypothetical protein
MKSLDQYFLDYMLMKDSIRLKPRKSPLLNFDKLLSGYTTGRQLNKSPEYDFFNYLRTKGLTHTKHRIDEHGSAEYHTISDFFTNSYILNFIYKITPLGMKFYMEAKLVINSSGWDDNRRKIITEFGDNCTGSFLN